MTRQEALELALKHVNTLGTNTRGYNDNLLESRTAAVLQFAEFLMGPDPLVSVRLSKRTPDSPVLDDDDNENGGFLDD